MFTYDQLEAAVSLVHGAMPPTPSYGWPMLRDASGLELWVKHENHTPTGAFKIRGGLVYCDALRQAEVAVAGIVSATRGNHGQSLALAGRKAGLPVHIFVPEGNSVEKNAAMRAFGAEVIEAGRDFDVARVHAADFAERKGMHMVASFDPLLVRGVATYALEFLKAVPDLDVVYVPVGMGSGISGLIRTRELLDLKTEIVGVVAAGAPAYARSFAAGEPVAMDRALTFADGMACRDPDPQAVEIICRGAARVIELEEDEIAEAMRLYFRCTHNVAEGAGAAPLAGALKERQRLTGKKVGVILCGGNIDTDWFAEVLAGKTPIPR